MKYSLKSGGVGFECNNSDNFWRFVIQTPACKKRLKRLLPKNHKGPLTNFGKGYNEALKNIRRNFCEDTSVG